MGSSERDAPSFVEALKCAYGPLTRLSTHELTSWIVARLSYLTSGGLNLAGEVFSHDTNEFGYKIKIVDGQGHTAAHGAVVFSNSGIHFAAIDIGIADFQSVFVKLLTESPGDFSRCEISVREPETKRSRKYGWDGVSLLK